MSWQREGRVTAGAPLRLGASETADGVDIAVVSRHATRLTMLLFGPAGTLLHSVPLNPGRHRTSDVSHVRLTGILHGCSYAPRAEGSLAPELGHRF